MLNFQQNGEKMKKYFSVLKNCILFDGISDEEISGLLVCLGVRVASFDKKYTVFAEGSPAKYIGIVLSGSVQITRVDYFGNRSILGESGASEVFGEAFSCAEVGGIPVSVTANEASEIMMIECSRILHTCAANCAHHRQMIFNLMKDLARKTLLFHRRIEVTSGRTTREKLLTYLALQAQNNGSRSFDIPFDRQELADYIEVDRSGLSAEISKLRREGILKCRKNHFEIL